MLFNIKQRINMDSNENVQWNFLHIRLWKTILLGKSCCNTTMKKPYTERWKSINMDAQYVLLVHSRLAHVPPPTSYQLYVPGATPYSLQLHYHELRKQLIK